MSLGIPVPQKLIPIMPPGRSTRLASTRASSQPPQTAELLGARQAAGYVGDSLNDVAQTAADEAARTLGRRGYADALRQGAARDPATATRLALAALSTAIDGPRPSTTSS